jgi:hypothetical protein
MSSKQIESSSTLSNFMHFQGHQTATIVFKKKREPTLKEDWVWDMPATKTTRPPSIWDNPAGDHKPQASKRQTKAHTFKTTRKALASPPNHLKHANPRESQGSMACEPNKISKTEDGPR